MKINLKKKKHNDFFKKNMSFQKNNELKKLKFIDIYLII
jgi:hypothetical protein